jgi:uncharacterized protein (DUF1697 family)
MTAYVALLRGVNVGGALENRPRASEVKAATPLQPRARPMS